MRRYWTEFRRAAAVDAPILIGVFFAWVTFLALLADRGVNGLRTRAYSANFLLYLSTLVFFASFGVGRILWRDRPDRPLGHLRDLALQKGWDRNLIRGLPMLFALVVFMPAFSAMKSAIPLFHAYTWDHVWIAADRSLHGTDPWRLLQPVLGYPAVTALVAAAYHVWILLIYAGGVYFCFFQKDAALRAQYFAGYFAIWVVIGVVMATALASVGPAFAGPLLGDHHYDQQMAYLRAANEHFPIMVLKVQDELLASYQSADHGLGRGITAMPSMHVAMAFLFFLSMRRVSGLAGAIFGAFAAIVMLGSVHLAYHYAVDGYVSIVVTWIIWVAAGYLTRLMRAGRSIANRKGWDHTVPTPAAGELPTMGSVVGSPMVRSENHPTARQIAATPMPPTIPSEA